MTRLVAEPKYAAVDDAAPKAEWFYLSFCDGDLPKGQQFLGAVLVDVEELDRIEGMAAAFALTEDIGRSAQRADLAGALRKSHRLGINPGGNVLGMRVPDHLRVPAAYARRLLTRAEALELDRQWTAGEHKATP